jgi:hypothetical protein
VAAKRLTGKLGKAALLIPDYTARPLLPCMRAKKIYRRSLPARLLRAAPCFLLSEGHAEELQSDFGRFEAGNPARVLHGSLGGLGGEKETAGIARLNRVKREIQHTDQCPGN